jgi:hypothetical protein
LLHRCFCRSGLVGLSTCHGTGLRRGRFASHSMPHIGFTIPSRLRQDCFDPSNSMGKAFCLNLDAVKQPMQPSALLSLVTCDSVPCLSRGSLPCTGPQSTIKGWMKNTPVFLRFNVQCGALLCLNALSGNFIAISLFGASTGSATCQVSPSRSMRYSIDLFAIHQRLYIYLKLGPGSLLRMRLLLNGDPPSSHSGFFEKGKSLAPWKSVQ